MVPSSSVKAAVAGRGHKAAAHLHIPRQFLGPAESRGKVELLSCRLDSKAPGLGSHYFFPLSLLPPRDICQALGLGPPDRDRFANSLRRRLRFGRMAASKYFPHCVSQDVCFFLSHFNLSIYFWPGCVFLGASGLSACAEQASHCRGFSCWGAQAPGFTGFTSFSFLV